MRKTAIHAALLLGLLISATALADAPTPVQYLGGHAVYGEPMAPGGAPLPLAQVLARYESFDASKPMLVSGKIGKVCQKQGCWMMLEDDGVAARVMMRDHAFSVPKDASGEALVFGKLVRETLSEEQVRHMAEESHSGQAPAAQEWRVDAAAVRIPGATQEADQAASS